MEILSMHVWNLIETGALLLVCLAEAVNDSRSLEQRVGLCLVAVCAAAQEWLELQFSHVDIAPQIYAPYFYVEQVGLLLLLLRWPFRSKFGRTIPS
jgi:hypothetical protein